MTHDGTAIRTNEVMQLRHVGRTSSNGYQFPCQVAIVVAERGGIGALNGEEENSVR